MTGRHNIHAADRLRNVVLYALAQHFLRPQRVPHRE
jgi:hypothetical protein